MGGTTKGNGMVKSLLPKTVSRRKTRETILRVTLIRQPVHADKEHKKCSVGKERPTKTP